MLKIMWFPFLSILVCLLYYIYWLTLVMPSFCPGIKHTWSWWVMFFLHTVYLVCSYFIGQATSMFIRPVIVFLLCPSLDNSDIVMAVCFPFLLYGFFLRYMSFVVLKGQGEFSSEHICLNFGISLPVYLSSIFPLFSLCCLCAFILILVGETCLEIHPLFLDF